MAIALNIVRTFCVIRLIRYPILALRWSDRFHDQSLPSGFGGQDTAAADVNTCVEGCQIGGMDQDGPERLITSSSCMRWA
jgi:hypothetical protein